MIPNHIQEARYDETRVPHHHACHLNIDMQNFYTMCEMAQILIKGRAQAHSWLLSTYPGKVRLPADILRPLPNEATNEVGICDSFGPS